MFYLIPLYNYIDYPRRPRFITEWACGLVYQSQTEGQFVLAALEKQNEKNEKNWLHKMS